jgi:hypothetical protein
MHTITTLIFYKYIIKYCIYFVKSN